MLFMIVDTETTGLDRIKGPVTEACSVAENGDEIIQIGGLVFDYQLKISRAFCYYCDALLPESHADALRTHNISLESIRRYIPGVFFEEVAIKYIPEMFASDVTFVGYNTKFDMRMIIQGLRNVGIPFAKTIPIMGRLFPMGRHTFDLMDYLPHRAKLASFYKQLTPARNYFFDEYAGRLPLQTNVPELLGSSWEAHHNALFDCIETYLLLKDQIWGKKIVV